MKLHPTYARLITWATIFGVWANLSSMAYTFGGWVWWKTPTTYDRLLLVLGYHILGTVAGAVALITHTVMSTRPEPIPPIPPVPPLPVTEWNGVIHDDHPGKCDLILVRLPDERLIPVATKPFAWTDFKRGMTVTGTSQGVEHKLTGFVRPRP